MVKCCLCLFQLEDWWLNIAYLEFRVPVPIHVNPGILTPRLPFQGKDQQLRLLYLFINSLFLCSCIHIVCFKLCIYCSLISYIILLCQLYINSEVSSQV